MENSERIKTNQYVIQEKGPQQQMFPQQQQNFKQVPVQQNINSSINQQQQQIYNTQQPYVLNQAYLYPQNYCQPVMINPVVNPIQPNYVVVNQAMPLPTIFVGYSPIIRLCPFCGVEVKTQVRESFNCLTCFIYCLCAVLIILSIFAICSNSSNCDCNCGNCDCCDCRCLCCHRCCRNCNCCYDAIHYCPNCGKVIGEYDSCKEKFGCSCCLCCNCKIYFL